MSSTTFPTYHHHPNSLHPATNDDDDDDDDNYYYHCKEEDKAHLTISNSTSSTNQKMNNRKMNNLNRKNRKRNKQEEILRRIDELTLSIFHHLDRCQDPIMMENNNKSFVANISQARSYTSALLVLSFVQKNLLLTNRTTTNREVYYFFVTHFRSQRECDSAVIDVANMLNVERASLGILASPKGKSANKQTNLIIIYYTILYYVHVLHD